MLVSFDLVNKKINVLQIPRETYAEYGDSRHNKLNAALASLGGERELAGFLEKSLGVSIDGYLSLDLDAFCDIVDAVGGVEIELDNSLYYNDPSQELYIYFPAGKHKLDGKQAEKYVRYRAGYVGGDIDRLDAQKGFLAALFKSIKNSINAENALSVASSLIGKVNTDVGLSFAVALGLKALSTDEGDVLFFTLPGEAAISPKSGASYYVMSKRSTQKLLEDYFNCKSDNVDSEGLFLCEKYGSFVEIYQKDISTDPISADELG
jgi:LCP family protein required for cell wall assembly